MPKDFSLVIRGLQNVIPNTHVFTPKIHINFPFHFSLLSCKQPFLNQVFTLFHTFYKLLIPHYFTWAVSSASNLIPPLQNCFFMLKPCYYSLYIYFSCNTFFSLCIIWFFIYVSHVTLLPCLPHLKLHATERGFGVS